MPGFSQRARVAGGDTVTGALRSYIANAASLVEESVEAEQEAFAARQREAAEADEQWAPLASSLSTWEDEDGDFAHGVRGDDQAVTQAGLLEYGDRNNPPSAFIRMGVFKDVANIRARLDSRFRRGGY